MKCKKCGEELPDKARFCLACGVPVEDVPEPRRLEEPLDPLAAGAVPLVPIAPPPRAYKPEHKAMRSASARGERRVISVPPEVAERAERAERGFVLPFGDRIAKAARAAKSASEDEKPEVKDDAAEEVLAAEVEAVTEDAAVEQQPESAEEVTSSEKDAEKPEDEKPGEPEGSDDDAPTDDEVEQIAPAPVALEDGGLDDEAEGEPEAADEADPDAENNEDAEVAAAPEAAEVAETPETPKAAKVPVVPEVAKVPVAPEVDEADAEALVATAPMTPASSGDDVPAESDADTTENVKAGHAAPPPADDEAPEPPAPETDDSFEPEFEPEPKPARRSVLSRLRGPELVLAGVLLVAAVIVVTLLAGLATSWIGPFSPAPEEAPKVQPPSSGSIEPITDEEEPEEDGLPDGAPEPRATVAEYSWQELSQISALIAGAATDDEASQLARDYTLCAADGTLDGTQTKDLTLSDGTVVPVAVAGFRHDSRADGSGVAGITFVARAPMAEQAYNESGEAISWEDAPIRSWANQSLMAELPAELAELVVPVTKATNMPGGGQCQTSDSLWLLSLTEVSGTATDGLAAEGSQYQVFADMGVGRGTTEFLSISDDFWWLRSPSTDSRWQQTVTPDGSPNYGRNPSYDFGVVAGFCL